MSMKAIPVSEAERIHQLDVIRGFALFGIFFVNMPTFLQPALFLPEDGLPADHSMLDVWIRLLFNMFVQTKFYTIFSFLFGAGFYLFMSRAEAKGHRVSMLYMRRLSGLFLIGMIHFLFLWYGDILHTYALTGLFLLLYYRKRDKQVQGWAWFWLLSLQLLYAMTLLLPSEPDVHRAIADQRLAQKAIHVYTSGNWGDWMQFRLVNEFPLVLANEWFAIWSVLPLFLFGFSFARLGLFQQTRLFLPAIKRLWWLLLMISCVLVVMIPLLQFEVVRPPASAFVSVQIFVGWSGLSLCAFYICSLLLLYENERARKLLLPLAPVGRMALTNYLLQTIVSVLVARWLQLYGEASMALGLLLCLIVFPLQVAASKWWLNRFRYGPAEWLWRCFTYATLMPIRKKRELPVKNS